MAKICIEVCIISARGLGNKSPILKPQWFAVAWIDPNNKYCTKIDTSKSPNPSWNTKFSVSIDERDTTLQSLSLTVEVYRREPIFLREHLQGTATVQLKEFLAKFVRDVEPSGVEETGSFQLRKRSSGKSQGLVDISVRICTGYFRHRDRISPTNNSAATAAAFQHRFPADLIPYAVEPTS